MLGLLSEQTSLMIDSGTTLTYFPKSLFKLLTNWLIKRIQKYNKRNS